MQPVPPQPGPTMYGGNAAPPFYPQPGYGPPSTNGYQPPPKQFAPHPGPPMPPINGAMSFHNPSAANPSPPMQQSLPPAGPMQFDPRGGYYPQPPTNQFAGMSLGPQQHQYPPQSQPAYPTDPYSNQTQPPQIQGGQLPPLPPLPPAPGGSFASSTTMTPQPPTQGHFGPPGVSHPGQQMGPSGPGAANRRLSADQMPSAIQVMESDRAQRDGVFNTGVKSQAPPLVTTDFVCQDQGNCSPRYIRSSVYCVPTTADLLKQTGLPFALTITPFAQPHPREQPLVISDMGPQGPVRCVRCKAYVNPFMSFIDGGRRFQCTLCSAATEVPPDYFCHLDHTGRRTDAYHRPELCLGSYELVANLQYCENNEWPLAPAYIFMIDVSYASVKSGMVNLFCARFKDTVLPNLPREDFGANSNPNEGEAATPGSEIRIGFVTYDRLLHFYNLNSRLARPQLQVVSDLNEAFVPLIDGFLVRPEEAETLIDSLLEHIPEMVQHTQEPESILGPVIEAGMEALKAAKRPGKLFVFHASLPTAEAPGKLRNRDDRKLGGTDKEKVLLAPSNAYYTGQGEACVKAHCSVDLFLFPNAYIDLASMGELPRLTGGNIYKYNYFQADLHGEHFLMDLSRAVAKPRAFDALLRVRTSTGTRPVEFYGNMFMSNTTEVVLACLDEDKAITVDVKHDDKLTDGDMVFVQVAVLYTSVSGRRRLRIHNLSLATTSQIADVFRTAELDTLMNCASKQAVHTLLTKSPAEVRDEIAAKCTAVLASYRRHCSPNANPGELILPEGMKLLPLYCNCLTKSDSLQAGYCLTFSAEISPNPEIAVDVSTDDRSWLIFLLNGMDVKQSNVYLYPRLLPLHNLDLNSRILPVAIRCSYERLEPHGVYLLENGIQMFLWIGQNVDSAWIEDVFGVQSAAQIDIDKPFLLPLDNEVSLRVRQVVSTVLNERTRYMKLTVVRQHDKLESWMKRLLMEDRGDQGTPSYVDYLCHIHKEIRNILK